MVFGGTMKITIFGINITISFLFCAILSILMLCDRTGMIVPMFIAVIMHELGHLAVMKFFGCAPTEIRLIPGSVRIVTPVCTEKHSVLILVSGSLLNIIIFLIVYISSTIQCVNYYIDFAFINLIYGIFNLLPFNALDGGSILEEIISTKLGNIKAKKIIKIITLFGAVLFLLAFIILAVNESVNYSLLVLCLYLVLSVFLKF